MKRYELALERLNELRLAMRQLLPDERAAIGARLAETGEGRTEDRTRAAWERLRADVLRRGGRFPYDMRGHEAADPDRDPGGSAEAFPTWDETRPALPADASRFPSAEAIETVRDTLHGRGNGMAQAIAIRHRGLACLHCGERIGLAFDGVSFVAVDSCPVPTEPPSFVVEVTPEAPRLVFSANGLAMAIPHLHEHEDSEREAAGVKTLAAALTRAEKRFYANHHFGTLRLVVLKTEGTPSLAFLGGTPEAPTLKVLSSSYALDNERPTGGPDGPFRIDDDHAGLIVAAERDFARVFDDNGVTLRATRVPVPPGRYRVTVDALARRRVPEADGRRRFVTITPEP